ncbi:MAG: hypothetical protein J7L20_05120 [Thermoplasmata archaeon]|nr:hypothetical protein [Thermoplasmata archaeon]
MPHQCIECGRIFEDGSPELLRGCPSCGGNKFIFITEPLTEKQRKEIKKKSTEKKIELPKERKYEKFRIEIDERKREEAIKRFMKREKIPETIEIKGPGEYELDLKGLLDEEPIIIKKDGSYVIHLPSLFEMINRPKK